VGTIQHSYVRISFVDWTIHMLLGQRSAGEPGQDQSAGDASSSGGRVGAARPARCLVSGNL